LVRQPTPPMTLDTLISRQNPDGGWPYVRGQTWTEPTVYAILALAREGETQPVQKGLAWLRRAQRPDGGWPAQASVAESSWVTALVALLPPDQLDVAAHARAIAWLLDTTGMESTSLYRLRAALLGNKIPPEQQHAGWPWVPGTAAWVAPTALAVLALDKEYRRTRSHRVAGRLESGRRFLLSRTCAEGGWNHGGIRDLGYPAHAYPEVTGMALAALRGTSSPKLERALDVARSLLAGCCSADAINWLRLGLTAHQALPPGYSPPVEVAYRTMPDLSLQALVGAVQDGHCFLWG
jgi:hypothetical protein